jgi:DNA-binding MarR family transcriptional regulator
MKYSQTGGRPRIKHSALMEACGVAMIEAGSVPAPLPQFSSEPTAAMEESVQASHTGCIQSQMVRPLLTAAHLVRIRYDRECRTRIPGLTQPGAAVIMHLAQHEGVNQTRLAEHLNIKPISAVRLLDRLERLDWVTRSYIPDDRRAWSLRLTPSGQALLPMIYAIDCVVTSSLFLDIDPSSRTAMFLMLRRLSDSLINDNARSEEGL